ncbi:MAG: hypothetical protein ACRELG_15580, partial [Gemmataceae bacterium]
PGRRIRGLTPPLAKVSDCPAPSIIPFADCAGRETIPHSSLYIAMHMPQYEMISVGFISSLDVN